MLRAADTNEPYCVMRPPSACIDRVALPSEIPEVPPEQVVVARLPQLPRQPRGGAASGRGALEAWGLSIGSPGGSSRSGCDVGMRSACGEACASLEVSLEVAFDLLLDQTRTCTSDAARTPERALLLSLIPEIR